jgi:hypothetical protein
MDGIYTCDSDETRGWCWVRHAVYAILAGTALLALLVAFAVELVAVTPAMHHGAHKLLHLSDDPLAPKTSTRG